MLTLAIVRPKGNSAGGEFPFVGVYGVDNILVEGSIRTGIDERSSGTPPLAKAVYVRILCKERAWGRAVTKVVAETLVWQPPAGQDYAVLGEGEHKFRMSIAAGHVGPSKTETMSPPKGVEAKWRLEAYAVTKAKSAKHDEVILSKATSELKLHRFSTIPIDPSSSAPVEWCRATPIASTSTATSPTFPFDYSIRIANRPFGPDAILPVDVSFRFPQGAGTEIKSLSWKLRRTTSEVPEVKAEGEVMKQERLKEAGRKKKELKEPKVKTHNLDLEMVALPPFGLPPPPKTSRTSSPPRVTAMFPLTSSGAAPVELNESFGIRLIKSGYTAGETIQTELYRMSFELQVTIAYKVAGQTTTLVLPRRPIHFSACTVFPQRGGIPRALPPLVRRNSDLAALPSTATMSHVPRLPVAPSLSDRKHSSTPFLPLPTSGRPSTGRRMSEQPERLVAEPARTRQRRDPPIPIAVPRLIPSSSSTSSVPALEHPSVSRSSTFETLGPDTPHSMEFLVTPITSSSRPHFPPVLSAPSAHPAPIPQLPPSSASAAGPHRTSHARHSSRSSINRHRPRTTESVRSDFSIASLASIASGGSCASDRRSMREMSAPLPVTSSSALLQASDGVLGLSLADSAGPTFAYSVVEEDTPMSTPPLPPHQPTPSPPSSPDMSPPAPQVAVLEGFRDPFTRSASPFGLSVVGPDGDRGQLDDDRQFIFGVPQAKEPPSSTNGKGGREMYVSPRQATRRASGVATGFAPTPLGGILEPSLQPPSAPTGGAGSSHKSPQTSRKGSLVGDFFSRITRRGSKMAS
ncbi:hypothetical protein JCM11251_006896 [Rhodosporidiobolus azoricus]